VNPAAGVAFPRLQQLAAVLVALWAGSLWTICAIVAPTLFALLDERRIAGQLAGRFFLIAAYLGGAIGALLLILSQTRKIQLKARTAALVAAALPLASHWGLGPWMNTARAAGDMTRFAQLHAAAGGCFVIACLALVVLVWRFNRPEE
jgi:hypothetical protein